MGKKKSQIEPIKTDAVAFKPPPATLNEFMDMANGVRMEAVVDQNRLTMRPAPEETKEKSKDPNGKDAISNYKKKLFLKNTLGWYYYLPAFMRPTPRMKINQENDANVPVGAIKQRNKMLLCEMAAKGNWSQCQALIDLVGLNVNEPDEEGELVLCAAAANGHDQIVLKLFRDYRVNLLASRSTDGATALIVAAQAGELSCVMALLECARILPVRSAFDHLKHRWKNKQFDARVTAVKAGKSAVVEALDREEKLVLNRSATCRHKCGIRITFGQQKEHENELCPVFTCLCVNGCGQRVRRSYMDIHQGYECVKRIRAPSPR
mmetsp:Transcript_11658/g.14062  ORF Transcript_11658/g.14062 Transcript_11658/m.14062 type:complete len:321 (-) Transcript_11658:2-964(-)